MAAQSTGGGVPARSILWVDYMKGFCIILVVMMHSTLGVEAVMGARGYLHDVVDFAAPFRIPAFFLAAGLFLGRTIDASWPRYLDKKVAHFAYFYVLWLTINCVLKFAAAGPDALGRELLMGLVEPFGTLWFIYVLPFFFVAAKLGWRYPLAMTLAAAALQIAPIHTGWYAIDQFAAYWIYFVCGALFATKAFALADWARERTALAAAALAVWFVLSLNLTFGLRVSQAPIVALAMGLVGAGAVIIASALLAKAKRLSFIAFAGARSLPIYLAFFIPMAATRSALARWAPGIDVTLASVIVTSMAVFLPLAAARLADATPLRFLFVRPLIFTRRTAYAP